MPAPSLSADAVRRALAEYDRLGADNFLTKYGYGRAKEYFIERDGRRYDSKAIAGVAHGYAHSSGRPLLPSEFSGGEAQVARQLRRLGFDVRHVRIQSQQPAPRRRAGGDMNQAGPNRTRRPVTFGETREALAYVLGNMQRVMNPAHHNYQVRLQTFFTERAIQAEFELDFIDVRITVGSHQFIGEIKVTSSLTQDEAFRTALGQILFYGHVRFDSTERLMILLDHVPGIKPLALATKLGIAVVGEESMGVFTLLNPSVAPSLAAVFSSPAAAVRV